MSEQEAAQRLVGDPHVEAAAEAAHEANRAYCRALGDLSQPSWQDAPEWQKQSARAGVVEVILKPSLTPRQQHQTWMEHKWRDGWTYGATKDPEAKTHPSLRPYDELSVAERMKDRIFGTIVRGILIQRGVISAGSVNSWAT